MHYIGARNVNDALVSGVLLLQQRGTVQGTRNGAARTAPGPGPVVTSYGSPTERVLLMPERDANPFFHLMEALWMLAGRDDVGFLTPFVRRMREYSDDGRTLHGAYGKRWRGWFAGGNRDQIRVVAEMLRTDPTTRRAVLTMWDPTADLNRDGRDVPCNTHCYFRCRHDGRGWVLDLTVCCRSNDAVWGAHGANAVHFSVLQEVVAAWTGYPVGTMYQVSNDYHAYLSVLGPLAAAVMDEPAEGGENLGTRTLLMNPYDLHEVRPFPVAARGVSPDSWLQDLDAFLSREGVMGYENRFFSAVAEPVMQAHEAHREGCHEQAMEAISGCRASDWRWACEDWLRRRAK